MPSCEAFQVMAKYIRKYNSNSVRPWKIQFDVVETKISGKVRSYFRSEMEFMKNEIKRAIIVVTRNVGIEYGYEETPQEF